MRWRIATLLVLAAAVVVAACRPGPPSECTDMGTSGDLRLTVCANPSPPLARQKTQYRAVIRDTDTGQPIENGEGQIYATSKDGVNRYDALLPGEQLGTYYGELSFVTAGTWGVAIRFRRDSTTPLQTFNWQQDVKPSRDPAFPGDTVPGRD